MKSFSEWCRDNATHWYDLQPLEPENLERQSVFPTLLQHAYDEEMTSSADVAGFQRIVGIGGTHKKRKRRRRRTND